MDRGIPNPNLIGGSNKEKYFKLELTLIIYAPTHHVTCQHNSCNIEKKLVFLLIYVFSSNEKLWSNTFIV